MIRSGKERKERRMQRRKGIGWHNWASIMQKDLTKIFFQRYSRSMRRHIFRLTEPRERNEDNARGPILLHLRLLAPVYETRTTYPSCRFVYLRRLLQVRPRLIGKCPWRTSSSSSNQYHPASQACNSYHHRDYILKLAWDHP